MHNKWIRRLVTFIVNLIFSISFLVIGIAFGMVPTVAPTVTASVIPTRLYCEDVHAYSETEQIVVLKHMQFLEDDFDNKSFQNSDKSLKVWIDENIIRRFPDKLINGNYYDIVVTYHGYGMTCGNYNYIVPTKVGLLK